MRPHWLDLPPSMAEEADVLLLPLPYEATASYGAGTANGPDAIWRASTHVELWDEELNFDLDSLTYHSAEPVVRQDGLAPESYLALVEETAKKLHAGSGLVVGVGGEHGVTPPLVRAAAVSASRKSESGRRKAEMTNDQCPMSNPQSAIRNPQSPLDGLTVVQFDAHSDLRDEYQGTPHSHACAMRRLVDQGARVIAVGIRSAERAEFEYGVETGRVETFFAQHLADDPRYEGKLLRRIGEIRGDVYLTFDADSLAAGLSPGTGTPQPGGLGWWQTLSYLRTLLLGRDDVNLLGCDVVETAPQPGTRVNEFTAARLLCKIVAYRFAR